MIAALAIAVGGLIGAGIVWLQWGGRVLRRALRLVVAVAGLGFLIRCLLGPRTAGNGVVPGPIPLPPNPGLCHFSDGTVVSGRCLYEDQFNGTALGSDWVAVDDWTGPNTVIIPELGCARHEQVTVSGGNLTLLMSVQSRSSCPQTWPATTFYNSHFGSDWPVGQPTNYDIAFVSMLHRRFLYGRFLFRALMPGGKGPSGDISFQGYQCETPGGIIESTFQGQFYTQAGGSNCFWPGVGSQELDVIEYAGATGQFNDAWYVGQTPGTPPFFGTLFPGIRPIDFYGVSYSNITGTGEPFKPFIGPPISDPTVNWHDYMVDWRPAPNDPTKRMWVEYIDGVPQSIEVTDWISNTPMFPYFSNFDTSTVDTTTLPQRMQIDKFEAWCPWTDVNCTVEFVP